MCTGNKRNQLVKIALTAVLTIILLLSSFTLSAYAEEATDSNELLEQQVQSDEVKNIEDALNKHSSGEINELIEDYNPEKIIGDAAKGKFEFNVVKLLNKVLSYFLKEIYQNLHILLKLIIVVMLCALLKNLQTSFLSDSVGELAFYVCYVVVVSILLVSFNSALNMGMKIIDNMVDFMYATIPVLITLLVSGGNITSGGIFQPVMVMIVEFSATVLKNVFIPLIFLSTILSIVNNISDKVQLSKLAGFLKQISGWALGLILTVFIAFISIQGSFGAVVDGVTSKTAKFAIGAFIPVAGKYLADAADTVIGCTLLIKNAAGVAAMIGIIVICIVPLLKILALIALYKLTCALIEPIAEKRITDCINQVAGSLTFIFGIAASVAFMFLITITVIISASNLSAMIR
jgi:stage III sporulation protein AE